MSLSNASKRRASCWAILLPVLLGAAATLGRAQDGFNILANEGDGGFKPKIAFSETNGNRLNVLRDEGSAIFETVSIPSRLSACVTGGLVQFPFSEIAEDVPVGVSVGGFSLQVTLGEDNWRRVDREGNLLPFDPSKKSAIYYFSKEEPPTTDAGESMFRKVGYVKFNWNAKSVTARVLVTNVEGAAVSGIYDRSALLALSHSTPNVVAPSSFGMSR